MKYIIFAGALAAILPAAQWLRQHPNYASKAWILFGFLPFAYNPHIALIDWAGWPGYVQGVLITGFDLLAFILFLNLPKAHRPAPFRLVMGLYFIAMVLSIFQAPVPMAAAFYPWQLLKVYFIYVVVRRASQDQQILDSIITGMAIALCFEIALAGWQRLGHGVVRADGSFGDKNLLGFMVEFATFVPFALLLAGKRGWQTITAPIAGSLVAILTASRAAVGFGAIGFAIIFILSSFRKWTPRKGRILAAAIVVFIALTPIAWSTFEKRFAEQRVGGADERVLLNNAAAMILHDHPFGIGANNYLIVANGQGYARRAGVPWSNPLAIVHSIYWLTAAETGYLGVITLILLWLRVTFVSLKCALKYKKDYRGDILLGLSATLIVIGLHNAYEWIFLVFNAQYLFGITAGMVAGLAEQLGYWGAPKRVPAPSHASIHLGPAVASRHPFNAQPKRAQFHDEV